MFSWMDLSLDFSCSAASFTSDAKEFVWFFFFFGKCECARSHRSVSAQWFLVADTCCSCRGKVHYLSFGFFCLGSLLLHVNFELCAFFFHVFH